MKKIIGALAFFAACWPVGLALASTHAVGTNVKTADGTIYSITQDGQRRPYTSAGAFLSYGLNSFGNVANANSDDLTLPVGSFIPPQDGKIICSDRGGDKGACYLISQSSKIGFPSAQIFTTQGFSFANVLYGDTSFLSYNANINDANQAHSPGVLINNNGTIYLAGSQGLIGISSMQIFLSWGYTLADVVQANAADRQQSVSGVMPAHAQGLLSPLSANLAFLPNNPPPPIYNPPPVNYPIQTVTTTPAGAITISADSSMPATQQIAMARTSQTLHVLKFAETSGNEAVNLKGLIVTATVNGGLTIGNSLPNTGFDTFKNFSLVNGATVITRTGWSSGSIPREGFGPQTYAIDFLTGSPLNFQLASSSSLTLTLKADTKDWLTDAAANSNWTFSVATSSEVSLIGQLSGASITPTITNNAKSNVTTVIKQPVTFNAISSLSSGSDFAIAQAQGVLNTQEIMGIFQVTSPSAPLNLTSITLAQSGSALPTGTTSPVTYYVFDATKSLSVPVGIGTVSGAASIAIPLNINSAINNGVVVPTDGSKYLVIKANTTNFLACLAAKGCTSPNSYGLSTSAWQWSDPLLQGQIYNGPFGTDTAKVAIYNGGNRTY
jgi:hypothetical protein